MNHKYDFKKKAKDSMVYVRPVNVSEIPEEIQAAMLGQNTAYAIHAQDGQCLAFARDRDLAFQVARTNEFAPVSVH